MKWFFLVSVVVLVSIGGIALSAKSVANNEKQKSKVMKQIEASSGVSIYADNSQGSQFYIQEANVKEISGDQFTILVGEPPKYTKQTSYPEVVLMNGYAKPIKSFAMIVQSGAEPPKSGHILLKSNLSIPPNSTFKVISSEWLRAERVSIKQGDEFVNAMQQPGLYSAKFWLPGAASDLRVTVGQVELEDGTKWMISPASNW